MVETEGVKRVVQEGGMVRVCGLCDTLGIGKLSKSKSRLEIVLGGRGGGGVGGKLIFDKRYSMLDGG